ncbi:MAG: LCP family protein, partial [Acidimicrobiales bacterium]
SPDGAAAPDGGSTADSPDTAAAPSRRRRRGRKKARRSWPERILLTAVIIVVLAIVGMGVGYGYVKYRFDQVTKVAVKHLKVAAVGQPFNMLVIGSDSRANDNSSDVAHLGPTTGGQRSDVVKIVHVDPATGQIRVLSIPRDTVVTVAGDTSQIGQYNRINSTYDTGPDQLVQTIEANFGIPISHVVQVNFEGFRGAVDAIGGINLNFPVPAKDDYTGLNITQAGCQHLNGGYSLAVARSRHYQYFENGYWQTDGTSDFGRIQRQNAFLKALITQAESRYNPLTLNAFIGAVVQGVTIDNTFTTAGLIDLAREFHAFSSSSLATATLPTYSDLNSSTFAGLGDVLYVQQPDTQQAITQFLGQPPETATTPPPDPDGNPTTVPTTIAATGTTAPGQTTTPASSTTTTTIPNFDPTPC